MILKYDIKEKQRVTLFMLWRGEEFASRAADYPL
jgi:hypothetical protein